VRGKIVAIDKENEASVVVMRIADGREVPIRVADVVRAYRPNELDGAGLDSAFCSPVGASSSRTSRARPTPKAACGPRSSGRWS
jgi:hypothetical protein